MDKPNYDLEHRHTIEEGILGAFLIDSSHEIETLAKKHNLLPSDFRSLHHKALYTAILATWEQGVNVDLITISNHRPVEFRTNEIGGMAKDWDYNNVVISQKVSSSAHVEHHIMQLKQYVIAEYWNNVSDAIQCINWNLVDTIEVSDNIVNRFNDLFKRMTIGIKSHHGELTYDEEMTKKILNNRAGVSSNISTGSDEIDELFKGGMSNSELIILAGRPGMMKCLGFGTRLLKYDGSMIESQNVVNGDILMGPDSKPREVLGLSRGVEYMYEVNPIKGNAWSCNENHILNLRCSTNVDKVHRKGQTYNYSVKNYLKLSERVQAKLKLWRTNVEFKRKEVPYDPYLIGLWIAEGTNIEPIINCGEDECMDYVKELAPKIGYKFNKLVSRNNVYKYSLTRGKGNVNPLRRYLKIEMRGKIKRVPNIYKINDRQTRLELLAGLLDGDGSLSYNCYRISTKYKELAEDIKYLGRTLGFCVSHIETMRKLKTWKYARPYQDLTISGNVNEIPVKVKRKKAKERRQIKNVLNTGFSLTPMGRDKFYGFQVNGDGLYLHYDTTVDHNTTIALIIAWNSSKKGNKVVFFSLEMPTNQLKNKIISLETGINYFDLKNGNLTDKEWSIVSGWNKHIDESNLTIISDIKHIDQIADKLRELSVNGLCDFAVFDYLQLIGWPGTVLREGIVYITRLMKSLAKECYIPIMLLSQLNRGVETRVNKRPFLSDLKESGSIEEDADIVIFPFNEAYYALNQDPPQQVAESEIWKVEFNIAKGRDIGRSAKTELTIDPIKLTIEPYSIIF